MQECDKLRVLHIENDPNWQVCVELALIDAGVDYQLDSVIANDDGAEILQEVTDGQESAYDIIIIGDSAETNIPAKKLLRHKRAARLGGYVITQSSRDYSKEVQQRLVDVDLGKSGQNRLSQTLKSLLEVHRPDRLSALG